MGVLASYDWHDGGEKAGMGQMIGVEWVCGRLVVREALEVGLGVALTRSMESGV